MDPYLTHDCSEVEAPTRLSCLGAAVVEYVLKVRGSGHIIHLLEVVFLFQPNRFCLNDLFADTHAVKA